MIIQLDPAVEVVNEMVKLIIVVGRLVGAIAVVVVDVAVVVVEVVDVVSVVVVGAVVIVNKQVWFYNVAVKGLSRDYSFYFL